MSHATPCQFHNNCGGYCETPEEISMNLCENCLEAEKEDRAHAAETAKTAGDCMIYVASRASIPARAEMWRRHRASGIKIISSWIDEDGEGQTACFTDLWSRIEAEVKAADRLVLYVEPEDFPLKGALIEVGMALALGKPVCVVAPGVSLADKSLRPLGTWAAHPLVRFFGEVESAFN